MRRGYGGRGLTRGGDEWRQPSLRRRRPRSATPPRWSRRGLSLLALLPILVGGSLGWASLASQAVNLPAWVTLAQAGDRDCDGEAGRIGSSRPAIEMAKGSMNAASQVIESIEPVIGAPVADAEVPIIFPGYVLPDDSMEEPAHEGS